MAVKVRHKWMWVDGMHMQKEGGSGIVKGKEGKLTDW